jgi:predicted transcriptional regulator
MSSRLTKLIWLHLLRTGRQNASDIAARLGIAGPSVRDLLKSMVEYGSVERHERTSATLIEYEVTPECRVPLGVSICELGVPLISARADLQWRTV